jgi:eukaryotic-like serine/threonine-protein kinase
MPPLQAPPDDDDAWAGEPGEPRQRQRWPWLVAALLLVLLLGGGAWWLLGTGDRGTDDTASTNPAVTSASSTGFVIDAAAYLGEPADVVQAALEAHQLVVSREPADTGRLEGAGMALAAGDVADLAPTGSAPPGATVTLYVAEEDFSPGDAEPSEEAPAETTASTTSSAPTTTSSSPSSSSPDPTTPTTGAPSTLSGDPGPETVGPPVEEPVDPGAEPNAGAAAPDGAG